MVSSARDGKIHGTVPTEVRKFEGYLAEKNIILPDGSTKEFIKQRSIEKPLRVDPDYTPLRVKQKLMIDQSGRDFYFPEWKIDPLYVFVPYHAGAPSIDRVDSSGDYTYENTVITTTFMNLARNRMPHEAFIEFVEMWKAMIKGEPWKLEKWFDNYYDYSK